jgi:hypothetical protein
MLLELQRLFYLSSTIIHFVGETFITILQIITINKEKKLKPRQGGIFDDAIFRNTYGFKNLTLKDL